MVLELDGEVCHEFSEKVTHLVCGRLVRNEKLLCAIAKGLVIVDEDYVVDSHAQSKWLEVSTDQIIRFFNINAYIDSVW